MPPFAYLYREISTNATRDVDGGSQDNQSRRLSFQRISSTSEIVAVIREARRAATAKDDESHALTSPQLSVASSGMTCLLQFNRRWPEQSSCRSKQGCGSTKIFAGNSSGGESGASEAF
jgi:hypothetical protein